ncbi:hypothetical protein CYMTET_15985 [Cymbomonas tetramitiformis]|uniref:Uncharacterized protein n=1 Tax=Cymbomonas tetramitiformis TaxID=36881 RepID=A0AAE0GEF5_9CHLO|nr:hypothetical protein CYMTET_15985 [Cymbomonas tetramitiformis]
MLCFGIAGAATGFGGIVMNNDGNNSVTEDPVMCIGQPASYSGVDQLSPEKRQMALQVFAAAGGDGAAAAAPGGDWDPEHGGLTTYEVPECSGCTPVMLRIER